MLFVACKRDWKEILQGGKDLPGDTLLFGKGGGFGDFH